MEYIRNVIYNVKSNLNLISNIMENITGELESVSLITYSLFCHEARYTSVEMMVFHLLSPHRMMAL